MPVNEKVKKPGLLAKLFAAVQAVGKRITRTINFVLIILVYFLAIGPLAVLFRLTGRNPLESQDKSLPDSFWYPKREIQPELKKFERQF